MRTHRRWDENWRAVAPEDSVRIDVPRSREGRRRARRRIEEVAPGTPIVLVGQSVGARRRCRRLARLTGVQLTREYVPVPSARSAAYLVEDAPGPWRYVWSAVVTIPPGSPIRAVATEALIRASRHLARWNVLGAVAPGRVAIGRRR
jgi:hypothetical protein